MRPMLVLSLLVVPSLAAAQDSTRSASYTRLILGAGIHPRAPVWTIGFERRKTATSHLGVRVMAEYRENVSGSPEGSGWFQSSATTGAQLLGSWTFRAGRRFEPYAVAGFGLYSTSGAFETMRFSPDSGFTTGPVMSHRSVQRAYIWGVGSNLRVGKLTLFGEMKLPAIAPGHRGLWYGPQSQYTFGLRF